MPNIMEITDFNAPELDLYACLSEVQLLHFYEPAAGIFIAESPKVVERALNAGYQPISILLERKHIEGEAKDILARCGDIPVYTADYDILTKLTGFALTRGMLCAMRRRELPSIEEICADARRIVILENVVNPTNIGAIFRSAAALNMDAILLTPGCSNPLYRRASRVSMGTVFQIPWTILSQEDVTPSPAALTDRRIGAAETAGALLCAPQPYSCLRRLGFKTVAMTLKEDSVSIDDPALLAEEKLAIILGTEGDGLADSTITSCDYTVMIPMSHGVDSLNVAAASAVAFWELGRR